MRYAELATIEARSKDPDTSRAQLREDVATLLAAVHDLVWRQTAAAMALRGQARGTYFAQAVDSVVERGRVSG